MKRIIAATLSQLLLICCLYLVAFAEGAPLSADVYVTVSDKGSLAVTQRRVTVTDTDGDNALTLNDALYCAHESAYNGGAAAGYATTDTQWGISMTKLWGDIGGNYGYYVNNASAWSLADTVKAGDYVTAFVYADADSYSDTYCFFDVNTLSAKVGRQITLTLKAATFDADYNPVTLPVEGATVTLNGKATEYKTDKYGKVTFTADADGTFVVSAASDTMTLVPPVCMLTVTETGGETGFSSPDTGDGSGVCSVIMLLSLAAIVVVIKLKSKTHEA